MPPREVYVEVKKTPPATKSYRDAPTPRRDSTPTQNQDKQLAFDDEAVLIASDSPGPPATPMKRRPGAKTKIEGVQPTKRHRSRSPRRHSPQQSQTSRPVKIGNEAPLQPPPNSQTGARERSAMSDQINRLSSRVRSLEASNLRLQQQLEELRSMRETQPENDLQQFTAQMEENYESIEKTFEQQNRLLKEAKKQRHEHREERVRYLKANEALGNEIRQLKSRLEGPQKPGEDHGEVINRSQTLDWFQRISGLKVTLLKKNIVACEQQSPFGVFRFQLATEKHSFVSRVESDSDGLSENEDTVFYNRSSLQPQAQGSSSAGPRHNEAKTFLHYSPSELSERVSRVLPSYLKEDIFIEPDRLLLFYFRVMSCLSINRKIDLSSENEDVGLQLEQEDDDGELEAGTLGKVQSEKRATRTLAKPPPSRAVVATDRGADKPNGVRRVLTEDRNDNVIVLSDEFALNGAQGGQD